MTSCVIVILLQSWYCGVKKSSMRFCAICARGELNEKLWKNDRKRVPYVFAPMKRKCWPFISRSVPIADKLLSREQFPSLTDGHFFILPLANLSSALPKVFLYDVSVLLPEIYAQENNSPRFNNCVARRRHLLLMYGYCCSFVVTHALIRSRLVEFPMPIRQNSAAEFKHEFIEIEVLPDSSWRHDTI